jgi:hypothetical protein
MTAFHPLLKFKLGHFPPSVVSLIHSAALPRAHRSGVPTPPGNLLRTGAANFSASGLKRQDNDLIVIETTGVAAAFKRVFEGEIYERVRSFGSAPAPPSLVFRRY